jgi:hypothetical protein
VGHSADLNANESREIANLLPARFPCVGFLLDRGAHISLRDSEGESILHYACVEDRAQLLGTMTFRCSRALMTAQDGVGDCPLLTKFRHTGDSRNHLVPSRSVALSLSSGANFSIEPTNSTKSFFSPPMRPGLSTKPSNEHDGKGDFDNNFPTPY